MRKWWPLVAVCLGTFMLLVDVTIVNVALPRIASDLNTSFNSLQWVVDGYALSLGVLLLGAGALGDLLGQRRFYIGGLALFALSSLACGAASGTPMLLTARVIQGIGGAAMFTTTFALLNSSYQGRDRGTAYGIWGGVSGAAAAVGPILGGLLTEGINWRWIFFVNVPVSIVAIALCFWALAPDSTRADKKFDLGGTLTFTVAATALTLAVIRANDVGWSALQTWGLLVLSAVALAAFVLIERRSPHAMLDLSLLRSRSFVGIIIAALMVNFAAFAAFTYTSIWLQSVLGLTPVQSGLTGLPMSLGSFVVSALTGRFLHNRAPGKVIGFGMLFIAGGALACGLMMRADSSWRSLMLGYTIIGIGVGLVMPILASSAMSSVPVQRGGMAAGAVTTARQLGFAIGIAVLGTIFASRAQTYLTGHGAPQPAATSHALAAGQAGKVIAAAPAQVRETVTTALRGAASSGLHTGFLVSAAIGLVAAVAVLILVRTPVTVEEPAKQKATA